MMSLWWLCWIAFIFMFLVAPLGYGWGYRSWGPPYPSYIQRRRHAAAMTGGSTFNHRSWGVGGDVIWFLMMLAAFSLLWGFWWR